MDKKKDWSLETLKEQIGLFFHNTKFVFGELNFETGKYEPVSTKYCNLHKEIIETPFIKLLEIKTRAKIVDRYFWDYNNIQKVEFLDDVEEIIPNAFSYCKSLKDLKFGKGMKSIPKKCFSYTEIEHLIIPSTIQDIAEDAFLGCPIREIELLEEGTIKINSSASDHAMIEVSHNKDTKPSVWKAKRDDSGNIVIIKNSDENIEQPPEKKSKKSEFDKKFKFEQTITVPTEASPKPTNPDRGDYQNTI